MPPQNQHQDTLGHERFDAYQYAVEFLAIAASIQSQIPRGYGSMVDQLRRASLSIPLNIAEGSGRRSVADRKRFYMIARGSAFECGALIDAAQVLGFLDGDVASAAKGLLVRVVRILTAVCFSRR